MSDQNHNTHDDKGWADKPPVRKFILGALVIACIAAALAGLNSAWHNPHPHFAVEKYGVFFAAYGFIAFSFIVLAGQHLRKLVGRKEDYYDERE